MLILGEYRTSSGAQNQQHSIEVDHLVNSIIDCLLFLLSSTLNVCSLGEAKRVGDCFLHDAPMALLHIQVGFRRKVEIFSSFSFSSTKKHYPSPNIFPPFLSLFFISRSPESSVPIQSRGPVKPKNGTSLFRYKFEQYLTSTTPKASPDTSVPVNENEEFCCLFRSKVFEINF